MLNYRIPEFIIQYSPFRMLQSHAFSSPMTTPT